MYSGQEIVSQEECKIVLAEFYEGVDCYNDIDNTIKFTLLDWATATYNAATHTLNTRNFSCRPVIVTEFKITFEAELPPGTTGLEVHMHTDKYERTRIMPLSYLPVCVNTSWDDPYPPVDWAVINLFCNTPTETTVELYGEIDVVTSTMIKAVGFQDSITVKESYIGIEFLDGSDQLMTIAPVITTETRDVIEWVFNEITSSFEEKTVQREIVLISVALAKSIRFSGLYEYTALLQPCIFGLGNISEFCNLTNPKYETRVTADTTNYAFLTDGWFKIGVTEFRLLPLTTLTKIDGLVYYFKGASQIEFRIPFKAEYDIFNCPGDGPGFSFFYQYPTLNYENKWFLSIYLTGQYTLTKYTIVDDASGDIYRYYMRNGSIIDLTNLTCDSTSNCTVDVFGDCEAYYTVNNGAHIEIVSTGLPTSNDPRVVWSQEKCKFIVTCESIGSIMCPCTNCEPQPDGESVHIFTDNTMANCIVKNNRIVSACEAGTVHSLGAYPIVDWAEPGNEPTASVKMADYIYFKGTEMFLPMHNLTGTVHYIPLGNLSLGVELTEILDEATKQKKTASFLPFLYMAIFKIPFKYVNFWGLDQQLWWDNIIESDEEIKKGLKGINPPEDSQFDFSVDLSELSSRIPSEWMSNYNWANACGWSIAYVYYLKANIDEIITVNNTALLDSLVCDELFKVKYYTSNVLLNYGIGVIPPSEAYGSFQEKYDKYVEAIKLLTSKESQAYAYQGGVYQQNYLKDKFGP